MRTLAQQKLSSFKADAERWNAKHKHSTTNWQWHAMRAFKYGSSTRKNPKYGVNQGEEKKVYGNRESVEKFNILWFYDESAIPGFRDMKKVHEINRMNHTGWYADDFQHETICGIVGVFRWGSTAYIVPGVMYSDQDSSYFDLTYTVKLSPHECWDENQDTTDALEDAMRDMAYRADSMADRLADDEREASVKFQAEELTEELKGEIEKTRIRVKQLISEIRQAGKAFSPTICETLKAELLSMRAHITECRDAIETMADSPYRYSEFSLLT